MSSADSQMDDLGSIIIERVPADMVRVRVRGPGSMTVNEVILPFADWQLIAIPADPLRESASEKENP